MTICFAAGAKQVSKNSSFEKLDAKDKTKLSDWINYGSGYIISEDNIHDDSYKNVQLSGSGTENVGLYQVIYGKKGQKYKLSIDVLPVAFNDGKFTPLYVTVVQNDGTNAFVVLKSFTPKTLKANGEWQTITAELDLAKYPNATGAFGTWALAQKLNGEFFIDNYECHEILE